MLSLLVDHSILLQPLQSTFGIHDRSPVVSIVLVWPETVCTPSPWLIKSLIRTLVCGVPQGSVLRPVLFVMYTLDLIQLIENHGMVPHLYAYYYYYYY